MAYRKTVWMFRYAMFMTAEQCHQTSPQKPKSHCQCFRNKMAIAQKTIDRGHRR